MSCASPASFGAVLGVHGLPVGMSRSVPAALGCPMLRWREAKGTEMPGMSLALINSSLLGLGLTSRGSVSSLRDAEPQ